MLYEIKHTLKLIRRNPKPLVLPIMLMVLYSGLVRFLGEGAAGFFQDRRMFWVFLALILKIVWGKLNEDLLHPGVREALRGYSLQVCRLVFSKLYLYAGGYSCGVVGIVSICSPDTLQDLFFVGALIVFVFNILTLQCLTELLLMRSRDRLISPFLLLFPLELPLFVFVNDGPRLSLVSQLQLGVSLMLLSHLLIVLCVFLLFRWEKSCNLPYFSLD